jgi:hypothetical protein
MACWKEAESYGTLTHGPFLDPLTMFEDVFRDMPPNLQREREEMRALLGAQRSATAAVPAEGGHETPSVAHEG